MEGTLPPQLLFRAQQHAQVRPQRLRLEEATVAVEAFGWGGGVGAGRWGVLSGPAVEVWERLLLEAPLGVLERRLNVTDLAAGMWST